MYTSALYAWAFWPLFTAWSLLELSRRIRLTPAATAKKKDGGSRFVLMTALIGGGCLAFLCAFRVRFATIWIGRPEVFWIGIAAILAGIALRTYAIHALGRFFTFEVAVARDHAVVTNGPYALVRHPSYTGALLTIAGIGLCLTNWASLVLIVPIAFAGYVHRMSIEEQALVSELGQPYADYMTKTKRLVPHVY
jgi:protein-S-isoprenylcysteine O-methyltransferase Ste14